MASRQRTRAADAATASANLTAPHPAAPPAAASAGAPRALRPEDFKGLAWRSVGPANMGGRVADISVAPGNPKLYFVAYGTGGLFKTANAGTTFSPVFDKELTASIGSVVVADAPADWPGWKEDSESKERAAAATAGSSAQDAVRRAEAEKNKGKARIVWVGTGEGNGRNSSSWGHGVYRSTDGGATFTSVGLTDSHDVPRLAVDPRNPDVCYVAALGHLWGPNAERGVFKTADGGKTWQHVLRIDEHTGACDVLVNPQHPDVVYAAMYMRRRSAYSFQSGGPQGGIYRSTDAGATWTKLAGGLPAQTGRIGLDVYLKEPRTLYAVVESDEGGWGVEPFDDRSKAGGLFRSDDGGDTWTRVSNVTPRAFYFAKVRVDPTDDQRVYLLGWGLWVSDDGGKTFRAGGARKPHGDLHAMVINPVDRDHLLLGTDGGVYVSYDRGATWDFLNHLATGEYYNVAVDMSDPYRIGGGLQDNGTWIGPSATLRDTGPESLVEAGAAITNADWDFVYNGDGFHVAFDPADPNVMYAESQGGYLSRIHLDTSKRKLLKPSPKEGQPRFRFNWNTPFFISPHDPSVLYLGGNHVFRLTHRGDMWERISDDLSARAIDRIMTVGSEAETHGTVVSLAESPLAPGLLWAGTDDGLIHVTADGGQSWANVTPPDVRGRYIARLEPSHHERETAYAAVDGHRSDDMAPCVLMTTDLGRSWTSITGDLPDRWTAKVVREDRTNAGVLYVGTENGFYASFDRGRRWIRLNGETLPTVAVDDIVQHPRELDLVIGTHGRSIYVLDDPSALGQLTPAVVESPLHCFEIRPARPRWFLPNGGLWGDRMFRAANPPMGARIWYWIRDYTGEDVNVTIEDSRGTVVRKLTGSNRPGLNRVVWDLLPEPHDRLPNPEAELGVTPFVSPGPYSATVELGKRKASRVFTVLAAPGG